MEAARHFFALERRGADGVTLRAKLEHIASTASNNPDSLPAARMGRSEHHRDIPSRSNMLVLHLMIHTNRLPPGIIPAAGIRRSLSMRPHDATRARTCLPHRSGSIQF